MIEPEKTLDLSCFEGHTPGPWACEEPEYDEDPFRILYGSRLHGMDGSGYTFQCHVKHAEVEVGEGVCPCEDACGECRDCLDFAEVAANAHLMAAAPELLSEVRRLHAEREATTANVKKLVRIATAIADQNPPVTWKGSVQWRTLVEALTPFKDALSDPPPTITDPSCVEYLVNLLSVSARSSDVGLKYDDGHNLDPKTRAMYLAMATAAIKAMGPFIAD